MMTHAAPTIFAGTPGGKTKSPTPQTASRIRSVRVQGRMRMCLLTVSIPLASKSPIVFRNAMRTERCTIEDDYRGKCHLAAAWE